MTRKTELKTQSEENEENDEYKPTAQELLVIDRFNAKRSAQPRLRLRVNAFEGYSRAVPDHPNLETGNLLLMEALGLEDPEFFNDVMTQISAACLVNGYIDESEVNFVFSVILSNRPRDHLELMLFIQMTTVHTKAMAAANMVGNTKDSHRYDVAGRSFDKLTRTFMAQMDCLKRHRSVGVSQVTVQNVVVGDGAQAAVVGNVAQIQPENPPKNNAPAQPCNNGGTANHGRKKRARRSPHAAENKQ